MKKILALVLSLVMVLGMATVAFAADYATSSDKTTFIVDLPGYTVTKVTVDTATADAEEIDFVQETDRVVFEAQDAGTLIIIDYVDADDNAYTKYFAVPAAAPAPVAVSEYVIEVLAEAYATNSTVATFYLDEMGYVLTDADVAYINNAYTNGWVAGQYWFLNLDLKFVAENGTIYYISAADYDYTWTTGIKFVMNDGTVGYTGYTSAEVYTAIRKMTGDVKNPYTFGWIQNVGAGYSTTVPTMTISTIVPQQWINVYGHKNLALSVVSLAEDKCSECGTLDHTYHVITDAINLEAATQTQRIEFQTTKLYQTLVLAKAAAQAPAADATDANPNTGANDMVNVAIVFAVVTLIAAGSVVFAKASK